MNNETVINAVQVEGNPSQLTTDSEIVQYTIRNFPSFIRQQNDLTANEKLALEHIFDRALREGSPIVTMTNSDIERNISISFRWVSKIMGSLVQKNWIDHKISLSKTNKSKVSIEKGLARFIEENSLNISLTTLLNRLFNATSTKPDTKLIVGIKCSVCGRKMRHTQISRVVDNSTELRLLSYSEGIVSDYEVEWAECVDFIETEQDSDLLSCSHCGVKISGKKDIIDYINKHPDCLETE